MYRKNVAGQVITFQGEDASTHGIKSGVTWTVRRCIDGTFAAGGGTVTEDGSTGFYKYVMSQADTNGKNLGFNFTGTGAVPQTVRISTDGGPLVAEGTISSATTGTITVDAFDGDPTGMSIVVYSTDHGYENRIADEWDSDNLIITFDPALVNAPSGTEMTWKAYALGARVATDIETKLDDVKSKTDQLNFTTSGQVDANIQYVNDSVITGSGTPGDSWGP